MKIDNQLKNFNKIVTKEDLYKNYCFYDSVSGFYTSSFFTQKFINIWNEEIDKLVKKNNKRNIDYYNIQFTAALNTFEYLYDNDEAWRNLVVEEYGNKTKYKYKVTTIDEEKYKKSGKIKLIKKEVLFKDMTDEEEKRKIIRNKLIGTFTEAINNAQIYDNFDKTFSVFSKYINVDYDETSFYIVIEGQDFGIDALLVFWKDGVIVGFIPIQYKYRNLNSEGGLEIFETGEVYDKVIGIIKKTDFGKDMNFKTSKFMILVLINGYKEKTLSGHSKEVYDNKTLGCTEETLIWDRNDIDENFYKLDKTSIKQTVKYIQNIVDFVTEQQNKAKQLEEKMK